MVDKSKRDVCSALARMAMLDEELLQWPKVDRSMSLAGEYPQRAMPLSQIVESLALAQTDQSEERQPDSE